MRGGIAIAICDGVNKFEIDCFDRKWARRKNHDKQENRF